MRIRLNIGLNMWPKEIIRQTRNTLVTVCGKCLANYLLGRIFGLISPSQYVVRTFPCYYRLSDSLKHEFITIQRSTFLSLILVSMYGLFETVVIMLLLFLIF